MNKTRDIEEATACLRQFKASLEGCSANEIARAEGIPLERCTTLLERLQRAAVIHLMKMDGTARFCLTQDVTALDVMQAVWAPNPQVVQVLFEITQSSVSFRERLARGLWPQG